MTGTETVNLPVMLNLADRCDHCKAQAFVRVVKPGVGAPLDFCGHHYRSNEQALANQGFIVLTDERATINAKPSPSANAD